MGFPSYCIELPTDFITSLFRPILRLLPNLLNITCPSKDLLSFWKIYFHSSPLSESKLLANYWSTQVIVFLFPYNNITSYIPAKFPEEVIIDRPCRYPANKIEFMYTYWCLQRNPKTCKAWLFLINILLSLVPFILLIHVH